VGFKKFIEIACIGKLFQIIKLPDVRCIVGDRWHNGNGNVRCSDYTELLTFALLYRSRIMQQRKSRNLIIVVYRPFSSNFNRSASELTMDHILWPMTHMTHEWTDLWPTWPMTHVTHDPWLTSYDCLSSADLLCQQPTCSYTSLRWRLTRVNVAKLITVKKSHGLQV